MTHPRKYTNWLYEAVAQGILTWESIAQACLAYMSEQDVENMCGDYEWFWDTMFEENDDREED